MNPSIIDSEALLTLMEQRRTFKVAMMNGSEISSDELQMILAAADTAPTHARTEPWRFKVYEGNALIKICTDHAEMYEKYCPAEKYNATKKNKLAKLYEKAGMLVIVYMQRTPNARISAQEEYAATCSALQNMLLMATSLQVAAIWSTGAMATKPPMKKYLKLAEEDEVVAFLYLGKTENQLPNRTANIPVLEKTQFIK